MEKFSFESESQTLSFEEQFNTIEEVELPSGTAEVGDFTPENLKDQVPVFFAPAWGCTMKNYKAAMKELFEGSEVEGKEKLNTRRVLSLNHPRVGGALESSMNIKELFDNYPTAELRKALNILEVLEEKGIEQVDVIAHSEGAINVAIAAAMYPEKFRSIVFFGPAGMMDNESWSRLIKGFAGQGARAESLQATPSGENFEGRPEIPITETEREVGATSMEELKGYFLKNPGRSINEIMALKDGHRQAKDILPYLHDLGINITLISAESDPVFPQEEIRKAAAMDAVDTFISVRGGHGVIAEHPEIVIPSAEAVFEEFAKKKKTPAQEKALADREYHAGVRYIPGQGLVIAPYVKKGKQTGEETPERSL